VDHHGLLRAPRRLSQLRWSDRFTPKFDIFRFTTGIGAQTAGTEALEEDLACSLRMRGVKILRGKNPGGTPSSGAPPGGCG